MNRLCFHSYLGFYATFLSIFIFRMNFRVNDVFVEFIFSEIFLEIVHMNHTLNAYHNFYINSRKLYMMLNIVMTKNWIRLLLAK